jgi:N-acetylneuraminic acid mutarotase
MPTKPIQIQPLEQRRMLCSFAHLATPNGAATGASVIDPTPHLTTLSVSFQPSGATAPSGFVTDVGRAYAGRGNGYVYGWSRDVSSAAVDRNSTRSPSQAYDTYIATNGASWEIAVAPGRYRVKLVAGDAFSISSDYRFTLEGLSVMSAKPAWNFPWIERTAEVDVADGKLTLRDASGAVKNKIAWVQITNVTPLNIAVPWTGQPVSVPGRVQLENFDDDDGLRTTSYDTTANNRGNVYRNDSDVDLYRASDPQDPTGYMLGSIRAGEWLDYTVTVQQSGTYDLDIRLASATAGGTMRIEFGGMDRTGTITLPSTGSWTTWTTVRKTGVNLPAGTHEMRVRFLSGATSTTDIADLNWISFTRTSAVTPTVSWSSKAPNTLGRYEAAGTTVNGKLYVFGGFINASIQATAQSDVYDPASNTWKRLRDMPERLTHAAQAVDGSMFYLVGGLLGDHPGTGVRSFWKYDTRNDTWKRGPDLPEPRGAGAAALIGKKLYFMGGITIAQRPPRDESEMWVLDLTKESDGWRRLPDLPAPRNHLGATVLNGKIYAIGGQNLWNEFTANQSRVDIYNPATNSWSRGIDLPKIRGHTLASTLTYRNKIYLIGGITNGNQSCLADVTVFDPLTNLWTQLTPLPGQRQSPIAGFIGNQLWVTTGNAPGLQARGTTWVATIL